MYATRFLLGILLMGVVISFPAARADSPPETIRIATFNVSLYGKQAGQIRERLSTTDDAQAKAIASIVQTVRPDILLVNELDYESDAAPAKLLAENYFAVPQASADGQGMLEPIQFAALYSAPSNTGIDSSRDLNMDGQLGSGNDAWGYGVYPGQYAMTVFSRFPIDEAQIRTFQKLLWKDLPGALAPRSPKTDEPYYPDGIWSVLRLSSKNHIDVPVRVGDQVVHVLASHPTPPVFDGAEDRNGCRNHDEVQFWNHYLDNQEEDRAWLVDDAGTPGGLSTSSHFVVLGDLNADPIDGSGRREAIRGLLSHPRALAVTPKAPQASVAERQRKHRGKGDVAEKTSDFGRNGFMRVDFVVPSATMTAKDSGVFWPASSEARHRWLKASDHRMVWVDVTLGAAE